MLYQDFTTNLQSIRDDKLSTQLPKRLRTVSTLIWILDQVQSQICLTLNLYVDSWTDPDLANYWKSNLLLSHLIHSGKSDLEWVTTKQEVAAQNQPTTSYYWEYAHVSIACTMDVYYPCINTKCIRNTNDRKLSLDSYQICVAFTNFLLVSYK